MQINLIAVGKRMPGWIEAGYQEYAKRLPPECKLELIEIAAEKRSKGADLNRIKQHEGAQMLTAIPTRNQVAALDEQGQQWNTQQLAQQLQGWRESGQDVSLLIGGPEGLASACLEKAQIKWSLSRLTLPHPLVRIIVAEQIYRAWSILNHHPYHR